MIFVANFLSAVAMVLHFILRMYIFVLFIRVVLSWIEVPSLYQLKVIFYQLTEPLLAPIRKFVPPYRFGGMDVSPIIAFLIILFIDTFFVRSLAIYAQQMLRDQTFSF